MRGPSSLSDDEETDDDPLFLGADPLLLHVMRQVWVRLEALQDDLVAIAGALKIGMINTDMAAGMLAGAGLLQFLAPAGDDHDHDGDDQYDDSAADAAGRPDGGLGEPENGGGRGAPQDRDAGADRVRQDRGDEQDHHQCAGQAEARE